MSTRPPVPALVGSREACEILGIHPRGYSLRQIKGLPEPVATLRCGSIWVREEIEALARERAERKYARS